MPPEIQVRTPLAISGNSPLEQRRSMSTSLPSHIEDSLSWILPFATKLPTFVGLKILQEACKLCPLVIERAHSIVQSYQ
jgi:hypothetical protein